MRRLSLLVFLVGCSMPGGAVDSGAADAGPPPDTGTGAVLPDELGPADRRASFVVPNAHDGVTPLPAIILLHGYSASGAIQDLYFGLGAAARTGGFYLVIPDGTIDQWGNRFWNATPACCDLGGTGVDDVGYLTGLMDELEGLVPVRDLYFVGHSNGGFMSFRMACERSERLSGIVSLAGSDFAADDDCVPTEPVAVLQIHGDQDSTILYEGDPSGGYPSAEAVVARWAARAGCDPAPSPGEPLDLDMSVAGAETEVSRYEAGCARAAALWTIVGGGHIPGLSADFTPSVLDWLLAQRR